MKSEIGRPYREGETLRERAMLPLQRKWLLYTRVSL